MSTQSFENLKSVIKNKLCTRCGTCVGLSAGHINFTDKTEHYLPRIQSQIDDFLADRIWNGCSAKNVSFPKINEFVFGKDQSAHPYLGHFTDIFIGFANNPDLRKKCSSGGIITSALIYLLKSGQIDGAVVLAMDPEKPWLTTPCIATTPEEIINAAQSKYIISSVNEILPQIQTFKGSLAYVGLPCQVHSIRKMQMGNDEAVRNIRFIITFGFC